MKTNKKKQTRNKTIKDVDKLKELEGLLLLNNFLFRSVETLYYPVFPNRLTRNPLAEVLKHIKPVPLWYDKKTIFSSSRWIGNNDLERFDLTIGFCTDMKNYYLKLDRVTDNKTFLSKEKNIEVFKVYYQKSDIKQYESNVKAIISGKFSKLVIK